MFAGLYDQGLYGVLAQGPQSLEPVLAGYQDVSALALAHLNRCLLTVFHDAFGDRFDLVGLQGVAEPRRDVDVFELHYLGFKHASGTLVMTAK